MSSREKLVIAAILLWWFWPRGAAPFVGPIDDREEGTDVAIGDPETIYNPDTGTWEPYPSEVPYVY